VQQATPEVHAAIVKGACSKTMAKRHRVAANLFEWLEGVLRVTFTVLGLYLR
jgi:hypothetical protein